MLKVAFDEMEDLQPWAAYPGDMGTQAEQLLADTRDKILDGSQTPEEALKEAQDLSLIHIYRGNYISYGNLQHSGGLYERYSHAAENP